jgi:hypothetical protein
MIFRFILFIIFNILFITIDPTLLFFEDLLKT